MGIKEVIFVGTPNCGTDLANPKNWAYAADLLVNLLHIDPFNIFGRFSGLLARLAPPGGAEEIIRQIPGLWAQNPSANGDNDLLGRLAKEAKSLAKVGQSLNGVSYSAVTTNYVPGGGLNIVRLLQDAKHLAADTFYQDWNDLVVNTTHVLGRKRCARPV